LLVDLNFTTPVHVWTGVGDLVWNGKTYKGVGTLGSVSTVGESSEIEAQGITLTLSGIPAELLADGPCPAPLPVPRLLSTLDFWMPMAI
jgi:hypothetical protein